MTVSQGLAEAAGTLRGAGVPDPSVDAELLLRHVLGWDRALLLVRAAEPFPASARERLRALVAERSRRVPLQHLLGSVAFWRRDFLVSEAALIPRPETEVLVETALELIAGRRSPVVIDVGTGTGCIALSIAADRPDAVVHAVDISLEALALAQENAQRLGVAGRVLFHVGDLFQPVAELAGRVDLVASNPPYVPASEVEGLAPEVRDHEPRLALVPPDGDRFSIYRRIAPEAARLLKPDGRLLLEIGLGMNLEVGRACAAAGLRVEAVMPDLQGIPRVVVAILPTGRTD